MGSNLAVNRAEVEALVREIVTRRFPGAAGAPTLAVHASVRHVHLCREHLEQLFGKGYDLTPLRELPQPGNFAAKETLTLVGPRSRLISNLRVLAPLRSRTQVELAFTDAIGLGIANIPIRLSGDLDGSPGVFLMGPLGMVELKEGVIRAAIHVHMNPAEAAFYRVRQGDEMKLRVDGDAGLTFNRVRVRVDEKSVLNVHMDTDEANACGLHNAGQIELLK
jgi:putative phosphotransacetylase